jgi:hypothetical protein
MRSASFPKNPDFRASPAWAFVLVLVLVLVLPARPAGPKSYSTYRHTVLYSTSTKYSTVVELKHAGRGPPLPRDAPLHFCFSLACISWCATSEALPSLDIGAWFAPYSIITVVC